MLEIKIKIFNLGNRMEFGKAGIFIILTPIILKIFFFINVCNFNQNINMQNDINIRSIDVLNLAGEKEKIFFCGPQEITLLFILNNSCGLCENNIVIWNRLSTQVSKHAKIIGLCFYNLNEANFIKEARDIRFPIYIVPDNIRELLLALPEKKSITILFFGEKIIWHKIGDLNADDYIWLKTLILGGKS
ncbi:MAG: hypothetical protein H5U06_04150 [Candidatus Aminicenantes bacterium]|nr:hypothetical protein [Candidatus Aminicenantes bacterium]